MKFEPNDETGVGITFSDDNFNVALSEIRKLIFSLVKHSEDEYDAAAAFVIAMATAMRAQALADILGRTQKESVEAVMQMNGVWAPSLMELLAKNRGLTDKAAEDKRKEWYERGEALKE